ncbi:MAG: tetratricopeptide repeat protein [Pyrinomonadaceae bacterium]
MARKRRTVEAVDTAVTDKKNTPQYEDTFQRGIGRKIEHAGRKLEGQGRNILYGLAALAVLGIIIWIFYAWSGRSNAAAQTELGKAIVTSESQVTDTPPPAGSTQKIFKTEKERSEASIAEFQSVAEKYGGSVGEKAKYFAAVTKLSLDRPTAIGELQELAKSNDEVGKLSRFALAHALNDDGKPDDAIAAYKELAAMSDPIVAKDTINFALAEIYEKQGKKQEAADLLFDIVKTASEAKDVDGKPVPLSSTAQSAKDKLTALDPERAKQIPQQAIDPSAGPFGG